LNRRVREWSGMKQYSRSRIRSSAAILAFAVLTPAAVSAHLLLTPALCWGQSTSGRIAFTRVREDVRVLGDYRFDAEIWVMDSDGRNPRRVTHNNSDDFGVAWSPDGKSLVFGATQFGHDTTGAVVPLTQHLYIVDPDGGAPVMLTPPGMRAQFPSWSPDGSTIAFHGGYGGVGNDLELFLIDRNGTNLRRLTSNTWLDARVDWSPDGRKLAFQSNRDGNAEIFIMNSDGSDVVQLTKTDSAGNGAPDWSPDGKQILFVSGRDGNPEIYVMNADGTRVTRVTNHPGNDSDAEWSPDGRIMFDRQVTVDGKQSEQLHVVNADGTNVIAWTMAPSSNSHAAWSRR
jgi:Tol biopolymer transport system component